VIDGFGNTDTTKIWNGEHSKKFATIKDVAIRKLTMIAAAKELEDLQSPPGNHLELLKGDRAGQHSIRINDQFRICFVWKNGNAQNVRNCGLSLAGC
jgi:proteic killer suppression protein